MITSIPFRRFTSSIVLCLSVVSLSNAQFMVVSSDPANGSTNVPLSATITINFSAPVDPTASFEDADGFYLGVEIIPDPGEPSSTELSPDGLTFTAEVTLDADTKYVLLVSGAQSTSGDPLAKPHIATFTTGSTLPGGSVSGTVDEALTKQTAEGAVVAVFHDDPDGGLFGSDEGDPAGGTVVGPDGTYTINYVEDGSYIAISIRDANLDGLLDFSQSGDTYGLYDGNNDALVDAFALESGGSVTGIDITIASPQAVSARNNFGTAQTIAESFYSDAALTSISGDMDASGRSALWIYLFYSAANDMHLGLLMLGNQFALSGFIDDGGGVFDIMTPLPQEWLDSDIVTGIANENGGSDFISEFDNVEIIAAAANYTGSFGKRGKAEQGNRNARFGKWRRGQWSGSGLSKTQSPTPTPVWFINYFGTNVGSPFPEFLDFIIHAVTGEVDPPLASFTSGRDNLDAANAASTAWSSDAVLVKVESGFSGVHPSGLSGEWNYTYYSDALGKTSLAAARTFNLQESVVQNEFDVSVGSLFSVEAIPDTWIDTPSISATADANSDDYRNAYSNVYVQAFMSKGVIGWDLSRPVWQFDYFSSSPDTKTVLVNAVSGAVIVGTEDEEVPEKLRLDQNYPNPFNPSTTIAYDVPSSGGVNVRIFDALGRQVRVLVEREQTPGSYTVVWDGRDDAGAEVSSGIYIYKLEAVNESSTRSMILLR